MLRGTISTIPLFTSTNSNSHIIKNIYIISQFSIKALLLNRECGRLLGIRFDTEDVVSVFKCHCQDYFVDKVMEHILTRIFVVPRRDFFRQRRIDFDGRQRAGRCYQLVVQFPGVLYKSGPSRHFVPRRRLKLRVRVDPVERVIERWLSVNMEDLARDVITSARQGDFMSMWICDEVVRNYLSGFRRLFTPVEMRPGYFLKLMARRGFVHAVGGYALKVQERLLSTPLRVNMLDGVEQDRNRELMVKVNNWINEMNFRPNGWLLPHCCAAEFPSHSVAARYDGRVAGCYSAASVAGRFRGSQEANRAVVSHERRQRGDLAHARRDRACGKGPRSEDSMRPDYGR
jgi:hypothetical protein